MDIARGCIAYVFWHWPHPAADADGYERHLVSFHERLRGAGVADLRAVTTLRLGEAPWAHTAAAPPPPPVYEDWYVVTGFAALEHLNTAAVSPALRPTHDLAAAHAAGGTAGLYALRVAGAPPDTLDGKVAHWFTKPDGTSYAELEALVASAAPAGSLWQRQMTLGPGAEFCLVAPAAVGLPPDLHPRTILREPIA